MIFLEIHAPKRSEEINRESWKVGQCFLNSEKEFDVQAKTRALKVEGSP